MVIPVVIGIAWSIPFVVRLIVLTLENLVEIMRKFRMLVVERL